MGKTNGRPISLTGRYIVVDSKLSCRTGFERYLSSKNLMTVLILEHHRDAGGAKKPSALGGCRAEAERSPPSQLVRSFVQLYADFACITPLHTHTDLEKILLNQLELSTW